jgi:hypothetical protein
VHYASKPPVSAVHLMNNDVIPTFGGHAKIDTVLSDNDREFCGRPDQHLRAVPAARGTEHRTTKG